MGSQTLSPTPAYGSQPEVQTPPDRDAAFVGDPTRIFALYLGALLLFLRVSMMNQVLSYLTQVNFRLLYVFGLPALLAVFFVGGIRRTLEGRPAYYWIGFAIWAILAVPFSTWMGSSFSLVATYLRADFLMLFVVGGLVITWRECKVMMYAMLFGGVVNLATARLFGSTEVNRFGLEFGTVANPNDFAGHLLLVVPFLLWLVLTSRNILLRVAGLAGFVYGVYLILASGSRGAAVGLVVAVLFFLWRGSARQKITLIVGAPILLVVLIAALPGGTWRHIKSFSANTPDADGAAIASSAARTYLFRQSVNYSLRHPLFGLGPGQFSIYEGVHNQIGGTTHGSWHDTHNTYTQVSSECGIPAMLLYIAGILSSFRLLGSAYRQARARPDCQDIRSAALCIMLGMAGYCAAITFLNFAYFFYLPAMAGFAIAFSRAAQREFRARGVDLAGSRTIEYV
jgi:O-antigen ligase